MYSAMPETLSLSDVRALLRLLGEVRELGESPTAWRGHLAEQLSQLCGARAVVSNELSVRTPVSHGQAAAARAGTCQAAVTALVVAHTGVDEGKAEPFLRDVIWYDHAGDDTLQRLVPLYGSTFVRSRAELAEDATWYGSSLASERFRRHDCDDFILAMCAVPGVGIICGLELFRAWGAPRFAERERLLVRLVQEELSRDFEASFGPTRRLSPRQRQVLALLQRGLGEKQVAAELDVSPHTVHDYVKAIYRQHGVSSRAELLTQLARPPRPVARLVAAGAAP
jgi:DNA-binding CsgD family transcriptional regulator